MNIAIPNVIEILFPTSLYHFLSKSAFNSAFLSSYIDFKGGIGVDISIPGEVPKILELSKITNIEVLKNIAKNNLNILPVISLVKVEYLSNLLK